VGNFVPVFIEQGNIQDYFQLFIGVIADVGRSTLRTQKGVALFPYTNGMGFNTRKIFQILYSKGVHIQFTTKSIVNLFKHTSEGLHLTNVCFFGL
jgi:hypothetical protein